MTSPPNLRDAEADGAFPEEVLGDGAADPRAFAAAWARERGLVQPRWSDRLRVRRALLLAAALVGLVAVGAAIGSLLHSSPVTQPPLAATGKMTFVASGSPTRSRILIGTSVLRSIPAASMRSSLSV